MHVVMSGLLLLQPCAALPGTCELKEDKLVDKATGIAFHSAHALNNAEPYALLGVCACVCAVCLCVCCMSVVSLCVCVYTSLCVGV